MNTAFLGTLVGLGLGGGFLSGLLGLGGMWPAALALVVGTVPGAQFGGGVSKKVNTKYPRLVIAIIIAITGLKMWHQTLGW